MKGYFSTFPTWGWAYFYLALSHMFFVKYNGKLICFFEFLLCLRFLMICFNSISSEKSIKTFLSAFVKSYCDYYIILFDTIFSKTCCYKKVGIFISRVKGDLFLLESIFTHCNPPLFILT